MIYLIGLLAYVVIGIIVGMILHYTDTFGNDGNTTGAVLWPLVVLIPVLFAVISPIFAIVYIVEKIRPKLLKWKSERLERKMDRDGYYQRKLKELMSRDEDKK